MGRLDQFAHRRIANHALLAKKRHTVGRLPQRIQVMSHHHHGQAQRLLQLHHQIIKGAGADRIQTGGRLIQKQQRRIQRQRPGQRGALEHAPAEFARQLDRRIRRQARQGDFQIGDFGDLPRRQAGMLAQRHGHVLTHRQRTEQRALLKQHAKAAAQAKGGALTDADHLLIKQADRTSHRRQQHDDRPQQSGLA